MIDGTERTLQQLFCELKRVLDEISAATEKMARGDKSSGLESFFDFPLTMRPGFFKGKRPMAVIFPDERIVETKTWKLVAKALLAECIAAPASKERMQYMRGKVFGRNRLLLAETPQGMDAPIQVAEGFYFESKFDTEALLRVITDLIFKPARYDYRGIEIRIRIVQQ